jgi:hypothetical protein
MFVSIKAGFSMACSLWRVLMSDKRLLVFPLLSTMGCVMVFLTFAVPALFNIQWFYQMGPHGLPSFRLPWWGYIFVFLYYYLFYFIVIFFNTALVSCVLIRFNGGQPTLELGLRAAMSRLPQILLWTAVAASVGMLLKMIESSNEKAAKFLSRVVGVVWTVITMFVIPILVVEKVGPFTAIKHSTQILKQKWGEVLGAKVGLGLLLFLLAIPAILLFLLAFVLFWKGVIVVGVITFALVFVYLAALAPVGAALNTILITALYQYAVTGEAPPGFDRQAIEDCF